MRISRFKVIGEGCVVPFGYMPSWTDIYTNQLICYPIGLHLIARWCRDFYFWLGTVGRPGYAERYERAAYQLGYDKGNAHGYRKALLELLDGGQ